MSDAEYWRRRLSSARSIVLLDEPAYFTRRALSQLGLASRAEDADIARVHAQLSELYLERARSEVERERKLVTRSQFIELHVAA